MAVKDGLPSTDFSRMNREYIKAVAESGSEGGGLPEITEADEGKVLGVENSEAAWVEDNVKYDLEIIFHKNPNTGTISPADIDTVNGSLRDCEEKINNGITPTARIVFLYANGGTQYNTCVVYTADIFDFSYQYILCIGPLTGRQQLQLTFDSDYNFTAFEFDAQ